MRTFDIDMTVHLRVVAKHEAEALDAAIKNFRDGKYNDTSSKWFEVSKCKEVL